MLICRIEGYVMLVTPIKASDVPIQRSFLIRLTCLWLTVAVLLGSSGFTVVEHACQIRVNVSRVQLTPKGCVEPKV